MVDFKKLASGEQQELQVPPPQPREIDLLVYIVSEHAEDLNDWERKFCASTITWLNGGSLRYLSDKQNVCLWKMMKAFKIKQEEVAPGYADEQTIATARRLLAPPAPKPTYKPSNKTGFDDMDDDIPF